MGRPRRARGAAVAGAARASSPTRTCARRCSACRRSPGAPRIESQGGALRFDADTDVAAFESALRDGRLADALRAAPRRAARRLRRRRERGVVELARASSATACASAWRGAALERLDGERRRRPRAIDAVRAPARRRPARRGGAARAHGVARARRPGRPRAPGVPRLRRAARRATSASRRAPSCEALHDALGASAAPPAPPPPRAPAPDDGFVGRTVELRRIARRCSRRTTAGCSRSSARRRRQDAARAARAARARARASATAPRSCRSTTSRRRASIGARLARELGVRLARQAAIRSTRSIAFLRERRDAARARQLRAARRATPRSLERLLDGCPRAASCIVTSRVRLALAAEWLLPLEGLPCPEAEDATASRRSTRCACSCRRRSASSRRWCRRSRRAAIVDICRQVEGLPLALELAAAWTRVLSCEAIAAELRAGHRAAARGRRRAPGAAREHRGRVRPVLAPAERGRARRARAAVGVPRRLLAPRRRARSPARRCRCSARSPTSRCCARTARACTCIRWCSSSRRGGSADDERARRAERAHARYFLRLLAQLRRARSSDGDREALQRVDTEFENCRAAWRWAVAHGDGELAAQRAPTLPHFCDHRGRIEEGARAAARGARSPPRVAASRGAAGAAAGARGASRVPARPLRRGARRGEARARRRADPARDAEARLQALQGARRLLAAPRAPRRGATRYFQAGAATTRRRASDPHHAGGDAATTWRWSRRRWATTTRRCGLSRDSLAQHRRLGDAAGEALCLNNLGVAVHRPAAITRPAGAHLREGARDLRAPRPRRHARAGPRQPGRGRGRGEATTTPRRRRSSARARARRREPATASSRAGIELQFVPGSRSAAATSPPRAPSSPRRWTSRSRIGRAGAAAARRSSLLRRAARGAGRGRRARARVLALRRRPTHRPARRSAPTSARSSPRLAGDAARASPWPGSTLDELVDRIVGEAPDAHAALIALLHAPRRLAGCPPQPGRNARGTPPRAALRCALDVATRRLRSVHHASSHAGIPRRRPRRGPSPSATPSASRRRKRIRWDIDRDVIRGRHVRLRPQVHARRPVEGRRAAVPAPGRGALPVAGPGPHLRQHVRARRALHRRQDARDQPATTGWATRSRSRRWCASTDEELKHQALFRRLEAMAAGRHAGRLRVPAASRTRSRSAVLGKSTWAVLALTLDIELFSQAHYRSSIEPDADAVADLWKDVFLFHWKEESQHAILDELEWRRERRAAARRPSATQGVDRPDRAGRRGRRHLPGAGARPTPTTSSPRRPRVLDRRGGARSATTMLQGVPLAVHRRAACRSRASPRCCSALVDAGADGAHRPRAGADPRARGVLALACLAGAARNVSRHRLLGSGSRGGRPQYRRNDGNEVERRSRRRWSR